MDESQQELDRLRADLSRLVEPARLDALIALATKLGARCLLDALDTEGRIFPCGQGCGWEGPWTVDSTLWPADRERLLGPGYRPAAELAEQEEAQRLLGNSSHDPKR